MLPLFEKEQSIELPQAHLFFIQNFFEKHEADILLHQLTENIAWQQGEIMMFGKKILEPRLTSWYGDEGKIYTYSGKTQTPNPWIEPLITIKNRIEKTTHNLSLKESFGTVFNSVLLNLYRNGTDSMGWHADDEKELGRNPVIASVNFGESRRFLFRKKNEPSQKYELLLTHGSLLIMSGEMQHFWQHSVPKEPQKTRPRINLTFRDIK